ncbi:helix-turn-helix domain-containing protein [Actinoallomurus sp. NBC_01490]|jgi:transcriptional regulator with XRE-family HTH domain|uniref:helix-turn-helix domain-containing protein n=1 Tax=Actinoallomurus sp. NBC_01490 TaxID=2903557 RepID=UPI002E33E8C8|nr:helix-turn-helix transcriptional regulator [Actinoallomurus sp. NBC_01490]
MNISGSGPVVLRILLGAELRRLRELADVTPQQAAREIGASESKISRMERGRNAFKQEDVAELLFLYGVGDETIREDLLSLARRANQPGWWHSYNDVLPGWFQAYVGLENAAQRIRTYESHYIPGLLQSSDYAAAVIALDGFRAEEVDRRVTLRRDRQRRFRDGALRLWAIIDEAALRRPLGGADVMRRQLEELVAATKLPNLTLQVTPFAAGGHTALNGFSILRFPDPQLTDVIYVEQLTNALYLDKREEVDAYLLVMERLSIISASPDESVDIINRIMDDY